VGLSEEVAESKVPTGLTLEGGGINTYLHTERAAAEGLDAVYVSFPLSDRAAWIAWHQRGECLWPPTTIC